MSHVLECCMCLLWHLGTHLWGIVQPLGYGSAFSLTFVAVRTVLSLSVKNLSVFCTLFQDVVGDEGVKLCATVRYGKKKVSAK